MKQIIKTFENFDYNVTIVGTQHHIEELSLQYKRCTIPVVVLPSVPEYCVLSTTLTKNDFLGILKYAKEIVKKNKVVFVTTTDGIQYDLIIKGKTVLTAPSPLFPDEVILFLEEQL